MVANPDVNVYTKTPNQRKHSENHKETATYCKP